MHANLANLIFFSFFFVGASAVARFSLKLNALLFVFWFFYSKLKLKFTFILLTGYVPQFVRRHLH